MNEKRTVAVLFADVCGSTRLFEQSGTIAFKLINTCLDAISTIATSHGGCLIRSKGDDILCTFPTASSAIHSAREMIESQAGDEIDIHIAVHLGEVIFARDTIFGDPVNIAARILSTAKAGEILATEDVVQELAGEDREQMRLLDNMTVAGKAERMNVYSAIKEEEGLTFVIDDKGKQTFLMKNIERPIAPSARITLQFQDQTVIRNEANPSYRIGRALDSDLKIDVSCVSRNHASITVRHGRVSIADFSSTGTWIAPDGKDIVLLRREVMQVDGDGLISLGIRPKAGGETLLRYSVSLQNG